MKHFNKQLEVNLNLIEPNNPKHDRRATMEGVNIIILIVLGFTGLFFYINSLSSKSSSNTSKGMTTNSPLLSDDETKTETSTAKAFRPERLIIEGHREAGEKIKVTIARFDKDVDYRINFGDGTSQEVSSRKVYHTYKKSGNFDIQLSISHKDKPTRKVSKQIQIESFIEVVPDAYTEK